MKYLVQHWILWWLLSLPVAQGIGQEAKDVFTEFKGCAFVPTPWADGDSFRVKTADGTEHTVRLYGADCIEMHVNDENDARRLRAQRRHFGISKIGHDAATSIEMAKRFGKLAADQVAMLLKKPFTVYTVFADARGDGKHPRIYAFITLDDNRDLASVLVEAGLARAFGVRRKTPEGDSRDEYDAATHDLELRAAKGGRGIWAATNWEALPDERREQRQEEDELNPAPDKKEALNGLILDPNTAARDDLLKLPGVAESIANRIIENRPYEKAEDLLEVQGIGPKTFEKIKRHIKILD